MIVHNRKVHEGAASNPIRPISTEASENPHMQDDQVHRSGSDGMEELVDEEDYNVESLEGITSLPTSIKAEELKQKLRKLREMKKEHDAAGEQLSRDVQIVERHLLDAICNED